MSRINSLVYATLGEHLYIKNFSRIRVEHKDVENMVPVLKSLWCSENSPLNAEDTRDVKRG